MRRMIETSRMAAFAALATALFSVQALAQGFSPVALVNDEVITGYDVEQRALLLKAAGDRRDLSTLRESSLETLIDDRLRVQAARRAGVVASPEAIQTGFERLSRQNNRDPNAMRQYFSAQGVAEATLDAQVEAEVVWLGLVRGRYMPRIRISDEEVAEAAAALSGNSTEVEYLLAEIRLPVGIEGEAVALANSRSILLSLVEEGGFGALARARSTGPSAADGGDLGWVRASNLSPEAMQVVSKMSADRVSAPFIENGEVVIYGLRAIREEGASGPITYSLAQLVVGVAGNASQAQADVALAQAYAAQSQVTDCNSVEALKSAYLPISGIVGDLTFSQMPAPVREAVRNLPVGGISEPIRSNDGFHILVLCDKTAPAVQGDPLVLAREDLTVKKLERYSKSLLMELRREAVIERR